MEKVTATKATFKNLRDAASACLNKPTAAEIQRLRALLVELADYKFNQKSAADLIQGCFRAAVILAPKGRLWPEAVMFFDRQLGRQPLESWARVFNCRIDDATGPPGYEIHVNQ